MYSLINLFEFLPIKISAVMITIAMILVSKFLTFLLSFSKIRLIGIKINKKNKWYPPYLRVGCSANHITKISINDK